MPSITNGDSRTTRNSARSHAIAMKSAGFIAAFLRSLSVAMLSLRLYLTRG